MFLIVQLRTRKFRKRSEILEKLVLERTLQIQEQKNNVEKLSQIGKDITSSLSIENIIQTVYKNVNTLMDASIFTIGLYKPGLNLLEFPSTIEKNELLPSFTISLDDDDRLAAWCFNNKKEVIIDSYADDYKKYISKMTPPIAGELPESILYFPLWNKNKVIGVISAQSFAKSAYNEYHINMFRNLATYSAIALENAEAYKNLASLFNDLKQTQDRLVTQSKLAALGELTAGIAHEIQNPLNFVNNFSEVCTELLEEMIYELSKESLPEAIDIAGRLKLILEKINHHGKRADAIVKGMLQHSAVTSSGIKEPTDINGLTEEFLRLSYHGLRLKDKSFHAVLKTDFDQSIGKVEVSAQDIGRAVLNLITNSFYAVSEKKKLVTSNGDMDDNYEPVVSISTRKLSDSIEIKVSDNGIGISPTIMDKIFQPFFTTKPPGEGTGLGLSLCYDIITKGHGGEIKVETKEGEGSTFLINLPLNKS
jgi:signal transduction histidine kinase